MKTGILIMNTGTPDAPTMEAIKPYLTEFLMDPAIISIPYFFRKLLVGHIVAMRPRRTVEHYQAFWTPEGSPFMNASLAQRDLLEQALRANPAFQDDTKVVLAMRYGNPSIKSGLEKLRDAGCDTVVLVPLYPQNVNVCAGTCLACAHEHLAKLAKSGWSPAVREVKSFHDQPAYRKALAESVAAAWQHKPGAKLIVSFHSTMLADIKKDPTYLEQCTQTKDWLAADLGIPAEDVVLSFQSRFDGRKWLGPFTEATVRKLATEGVDDICVVCPGFVADNLETAVEVDRDLRASFEVSVATHKQVLIEKATARSAFRAQLPQGSSDADQKDDSSFDAHAMHVGMSYDKANREVARALKTINRTAAGQEPASFSQFAYAPALGANAGLIEAIVCAIEENL